MGGHTLNYRQDRVMKNRHDVWILEVSALANLKAFLVTKPELEVGELEGLFKTHPETPRTEEGRMSALLWKWFTSWFENPIPEDCLGECADREELALCLRAVAVEIVDKFDVLDLSVICMTGLQCLNETDIAIGMLRPDYCPG
jgi:hypothetical protein